MARKVIILDQIGIPSDLRYRVAFWLSVPASRQAFLADATAKSVVIGVTTAELTAIQSGQVTEQLTEASYPVGTATATITADLITRYNAAQTLSDSLNYWNRYGTSWDGNSWTSVTVA